MADDSASIRGDQAKRLYKFAYKERGNDAAVWFPEYNTLHRMNIARINNELAICKKQIYEIGSASDTQMGRLRKLLDDQANAVRNFEYIQSQEWLNPKHQLRLQNDVSRYFKEIVYSDDATLNAFDSETYRRLAQRPKPYEHGDPLRHFLSSHLRPDRAYSAEDMKTYEDDFNDEYPPPNVSPLVEILARFIIAMFGAISILVPMIIMSLNPSKTKSLITTSVATVIFACCCSLTLRTANDQTLAATAGYAAVLMVFVGLNS